MKKLFILFSMLLACLPLCAQRVTVVSDECPLAGRDVAGYFPQLSPDGNLLLYSPTEATSLTLLNLKTGDEKIIASEGVPGFDARFGLDGKVYYVTMHPQPGNLIYRASRCYDPAKEKTDEVLAPQHGQVLAIPTGKSAAIVGEKESFNFDKGTFAFTRGSYLYVVKNGKVKRLQPVKDSVGYLWAQVSPKGDKVVFKAVAKGLYVVDLDGNILSRMGYYMMPSWLDNDYLVAMNGTDGVQKRLGQQIYLLRADGTFEYPLTDPELSAVQPMAAADKVVFTTGKGEVHIMKIEIDN